MKAFLQAIILACACASFAWAGQVPNPLNAPASSTAGHIVTIHANNSQQGDDGGALIGSGSGNVCTNGGTCTLTGKSIDGSEINSGTVPAAQLPNPTATTLGGVKSKASVSHQFLNTISTSGVPGSAQPAAADVSGLAASATTDTTNASNITSGTLPAAQLPTPTTVTLGGVTSRTALSHQFMNSISTFGVPALAQPAAADLSDGTTGSGSVVLATSPTLVTPALGTPSAVVLTNATSIPAAQLTGTVPAAALPNPSSSTLGGVQSKAAVSHQFLTSISTSGVPALAQPASTDLSDIAIGAVASDITISSQTTLQNATGMAFTIGSSATEKWYVELVCVFTAANTTMDVKVGWNTMPSGATMLWGPTDLGQMAITNGFGVYATSSTPASLLPATNTYSEGSGSAGSFGYRFAGFVYGGGTGGSIQFQFAQNTSDAGNLVLKAGSFLRATKIAN